MRKSCVLFGKTLLVVLPYSNCIVRLKTAMVGYIVKRVAWRRCFLIFWLCVASCLSVLAQSRASARCFRVMEYNVENLFDCEHDTLKDDLQFTPSGSYEWTPGKYWRKLNAVARGIVLGATQDDEFHVPDIIGLCEVENDSVLHSLTRRSLLRGAGYEYVMTNSPDNRGIDVALLYQPLTFKLLNHYSLRIDTIADMRPTRDILYVKGETFLGELNVFMVHFPSRSRGERATRPFRQEAMNRLCQSLDSICRQEPEAKILIMGDFNDYSDDKTLRQLHERSFVEVTSPERISFPPGIKGTYRYQGLWGSLDHVFVSASLLSSFRSSAIASHPSLVEYDSKYGGMRPYRFFRGPTIYGGYSDHLPILVEFSY